MNPRKSVADHKLTGSHISRALNRPPAPQLEKRAELEQLFADLQERRANALADVKKNGAIINQEKSNARGMIYLQRVLNPALRIAQQCEVQLVQIAKLLTDNGDEQLVKSAEQLLADTDKLLARMTH